MKQRARFYPNKQTNERRNSARDSCVTKKTGDEIVHEILASQTNKRRNSARDSRVTNKPTREETLPEILAYNKKTKDETWFKICARQTNKQEKIQYARFSRNKQINKRRTVHENFA